MAYGADSQRRIERANYLATLALGLLNQVDEDDGLDETDLTRARNCLDTASKRLGSFSGDHLDGDTLADYVDWKKYRSQPLSEYTDQ